MKNSLFFFFVGIFYAHFAFSNPEVLSLNHLDVSYKLSSPYFLEWEDSLGNRTIHDILVHQDKFKKPLVPYFSNQDPKSAYWFKLRLDNNAPNEPWYLVSHNYGISEIDVFEVDEKGEIIHTHFDKTVSVYERNIKHRQPVFELHLENGESKDIYIRIKNSYSFHYTFELFSPNQFVSFYFLEYLWFGVFYGMLLFVVLYNFTLYLNLRDFSILIFVVVTIIQIFCMSFRDGTSIFIFLKHSEWTYSIYNLSLAFFFITLAGYTVFFLKLNRNKTIRYYFITLCMVRIFGSLLTIERVDFRLYHLDMFMLASCLCVALFRWSKNDPLAKYVSLGLLSLLVTYSIYCLSLFKLIPVSNFSYFALYFGVVAESIFLTLASSERIKRIKVDHREMEKLNRKLEVMVAERTETIVQQNEMLQSKAEELNQFLYKSSHDIKGPIKSIEGLCLVAKMEKPENLPEYIDKILNRSKVLGSVVSDLNQVLAAKNAPLQRSLIDFKEIQHEICQVYEAFPGYKDTRIDFQLLGNLPFLSDKPLILSIYQNLFENAIKYRDKEKDSSLSIVIDSNEKECTWMFVDNGIGIREEEKNNVFEMFYKANDVFQDSNGLGLYLVKVSVEKLQGSIRLQSTIGQGTTFYIHFPKP